MGNISIKKILVTTDLSDASLSAMEYAVWISKKERSEITLLYCVDSIPSIAYHTVDLTYDKFRSQIMDEEERHLHKFAAKSFRLFKKKTKLVLTEGNAARSIVDFARSNTFDIIIMNTHGRTGIQHAMLGSVAEKVVRTAHCPVLTIKSDTMLQKISPSRPRRKRK